MVTKLEADLRVIRAPNPSPMTQAGTNTYLLGEGELCLIDPGPDDDTHLATILECIAPLGTLGYILVTHTHLDHSALALRLARETGAEILGFGDYRAGRSELMTCLADQGLSGGGEGVDYSFLPNRALADDACVPLAGEQIRVFWTPGHASNHLCFQWRGAVFSGDHVMGWSTTFVSPPDGDLGAYMRSLTRLETASPRRLYPGHGDPVDDPAARIADLRRHRLMREHAILTALASGPKTISSLVSAIYTDTPVSLHHAAARNVFAHLIDLHERGLVTTGTELSPEAVFFRGDPRK